MAEQPVRRSLSKEAWVAVGGVGAAVVTGVVTLLVHFLPSADPAPSAVPGAPSATPTATATATESAAPIERMVGRWAGNARDSSGATFRITLVINAGCTAGASCGSIGVDHVPCYGEIFLESADADEVEFRVDNFDKRSNRSVCQPGAGERFRLRPDGRLAYRTTYEPVAEGVLDRA